MELEQIRSKSIQVANYCYRREINLQLPLAFHCHLQILEYPDGSRKRDEQREEGELEDCRAQRVPRGGQVVRGGLFLFGQEVAVEVTDSKLTPGTRATSSLRSADCSVANLGSTDIKVMFRQSLSLRMAAFIR
jgi:hypothetical protein